MTADALTVLVVDDDAEVREMISAYLALFGHIGVLAAGLYAFTQSWNEFLYALVFTTGDVYGWGFLMAGAVLTTLPVIAAYIYLQKYMVEGLTAGSVKG